jgi:protein TonB
MTMYRWFIAALCAVLLHLGAFYAFFSQPPVDDGAQGWGKHGIEFGLGMFVADMGASNLAGKVYNGPDSADSDRVKPISTPPAKTQSTPVQTITAEKKVQKRIKTDNAPERQHQPKSDSSTFDLKLSETKGDESTPLAANVEPETETGTTKVESAKHNVSDNVSDSATSGSITNDSLGTQGAKAAVLTSGSGNTTHAGGNPHAKTSYFTKLNATLARHKFYPLVSRKRKEEGVVTVSFNAHPNGRASGIRVTKGSGFRNLDKAVIDMVKRAQPLPKFTEGMDDTPIEVVIPIEFRLN